MLFAQHLQEAANEVDVPVRARSMVSGAVELTVIELDFHSRAKVSDLLIGCLID